MIEVDGLVQRFGRAVPDAVALLHHLVRLQRDARSGGAVLEIVFARFGREAQSGLDADLAALGLAAVRDGLAARAQVLDTSDLRAAAPGERVMLFAGREVRAAGAVASGVVAYRVSDRAAGDQRSLVLAEALRVVAEALRMPVPRPMSPASRLGALIAVPAGSARAARARGTDALCIDLRADWLQIGDAQILYVEDEALRRRLLEEIGASCVAEGIRLNDLWLAKAEDGTGNGAPLFARKGFRIEAAERAESSPWRQVRRARFATAQDVSVPSGDSLPSVRDWGASREARAEGPPAAAMLDWSELAGRSFAWPCQNGEAEEMICVLHPREPVAGEAMWAFAAALDERLRVHGVRLAIFHGTDLAGDRAFDHPALWQQERNRVIATVRIRPGGASAAGFAEAHHGATPDFVVADGDEHALDTLADALRMLVLRR